MLLSRGLRYPAPCFRPISTISMSRRSLSAVIFDLDGTLTAPDAIDFSRMRQRCGFPTREQHGGSILKLVEALPSEAEQARCHAIIKEEEALGMLNMKLNQHIDETFKQLHAHQLRAAIVTRNNVDAIERFRTVLGDLHADTAALFSPCLARDAICPVTTTPLRNKPHADPALAVLRAWNKIAADFEALQTDDETCLPPETHEDVLFVGDHLDDLRTGRRAGCLTALITNHQHEKEGSHAHEFAKDASIQHYADYVVSDGLELANLIDKLARGDDVA
eukprot:m.55990 g.55990  ORF g.55990 m.55990 type:complete len:277 (+) comp13674_c0_seq2:56-886(+)